MNTGQYYFDKLSAKEQKEFEINYNRQERILPIKDFLKAKYPTFDKFIAYGFNWYSTPQKHNYWEDISNRKVDEPQTQTP